MIIYIDDILIFAPTKEQLREYTKEVLSLLKTNDLYVKPEKCKFEVEEVDFLGFIIKQGKIAMNPAKIKGLRDWPVPTTLKELCSFLGFRNFY